MLSLTLFSQNLDVVFFVYGLSFILLGVIVFLQLRATKKSEFQLIDILWLLGWFGITHGINEFIDMFAIIKGASFFSQIAGPAMLISSFIFLLFFGYQLTNISKKKEIGKWFLIMLMLLFVALPVFWGVSSYKVWQISARYFLGFPGAVLSAIGFLLYYQKESGKLSRFRIKGYFVSAALSFGIYGIISGLVVPPAHFFPAAAVNTESFLLMTGFPAQLFRAVCAMVIAWSIWQIVHIFIAEEEAVRQAAEEAIRRDSETQTVINALLRLSLEPIPLVVLLKQALELLLSIPWLALEKKGCVFVAEGDDPRVLVMEAQSGLSEYIKKSCAKVDFGKCLCGRAALSKEIVFADHVDARHEISYQGIIPHGHYCVPILFSGEVLGVINLYVLEGRSQKPREVEFLTAVANALAGVIQRRRAEERIVKMDKLKDEFLSIVTHDLKSPLVSVISYSDLLLRGTAGEISEKQNNYINIIKNQGNILREMIDSILDYTRLEFGRIVVERTPFMLNPWIRELAEGIRPQIDKKKISIGVNLLSEDVEVKGDKGMVSRVITNLIGNAIKYTPDGGSIEVLAEKGPGVVRISVKDSGRGVAREHLPHLFDKFYMVDAHLARERQSLGLGLYIAKSFIEAHGGKIWAESEGEGKGTTFAVELPV